jgi:WD40 repeat protein
MEICLREIRRCQETRVQPNFIVLLGDRYGWQPLPPRIPATEFDALLVHIPTGAARALTEQWYRLDKNGVPPEYCLQPRTDEFVTSAAWDLVERPLHEALENAARSAGMSDIDRIKHEASATHQEILAGLGKTDADRRHVYGFFRRPTGKTDARLDRLKSHLRDALPGNITEFDPADVTALCDSVFSKLRQVIEQEVKQFEEQPALDLELETHDRFAEDRCRVFTGRQTVLATIADYIRGPERRMLVLHGASGSGKSAVMAKASQVYDGPSRVIRRFIGGSPESTNGHALLTSLCQQIAPGDTPADYSQLERALCGRLMAVEEPLVLFIDALDQLAANDPAGLMNWLPRELPPHVKVIVSTTADGGRLLSELPVHLERMEKSEGRQALEEWLVEARRTLQSWQREKLLTHFERCGLPLYLKLATEEGLLWKSYASNDACILGEGVAGVIDTLFDRLGSNANHGPTLVRYSLGYLAAARYGLTENEVLDVLTADDIVWSDFDQRTHHEVSERRLPVVVWSRLSLDMEPYLTERAAPGGVVMAFYHRQLAERAAERFLGEADLRARHSDLARHFLAQPTWLDERRDQANARRAVELVFQQRGAQQWAEAEEALLDSQGLYAKCVAGLALDVVGDFEVLLHEAPKGSLLHREALGLLQRALQLAMNALIQTPQELPIQLLGRLAPQDAPCLDKCLTQARRMVRKGWLLPTRPTLTPPGAEVRRFEAHANPVFAVAVLPDGRIVSGSDDRTLRIWDPWTGAELRRLEGHADWVRAVAVLPDGRIVSGSDDRTLRIWDSGTGAELRRLEGHTDPVEAVAVLPGGRIVSGARDCTVRLWDPENGGEIRRFKGHRTWVSAVAVLPDGRIVSGSVDRTLRLWDPETGAELRRFEVYGNGVNSVGVLPNGRIVSAAEDRILRIWDPETGAELRRLEGHTRSVNAVAALSDGRIVSGSYDDTLRLWDPENGVEIRCFTKHSGSVRALAAMSDGHVVSGGFDNTLRLWDPGCSIELARSNEHNGSVNSIALLPGAGVVSGSSDRTVRLWNPETGAELRRFEGHTREVNAVAVLPDGCIASGSTDGTVRLWNSENGAELRRLKGHVCSVLALAVLPDGRVLAGSEYRTLMPDGRFLYGAEDDTLRLWAPETGSCLRSFKGYIGTVRAIAVLPNGRFISGSDDGALRLWDPDIGAELRRKPWSGRKVTAVAALPDGRIVYALETVGDEPGGSRGTKDSLVLWNPETGDAESIDTHCDRINAVAALPDGRIVSGARDYTVRLWDPESGEQGGRITLDAAVTALATTPQGRIIAGDALGRIHILDWAY